MTSPEPIPQTAEHPALLKLQERRAADLQLRLADAITKFAGSMMFVYIHAAIFGAWIISKGLGKDPYPFGLLTMIVSLEAIFLSTFVMIGQNRSADVAAAKAAHDFNEQEQELHLNTETTQAVHELTKAIHEHLGIADPPTV